MTESEFVTITEAVKLFALGETRIRQLAAAGMGHRLKGRWRVSKQSLAAYLERHACGLPPRPPTRDEMAAMLVAAGEALRGNDPRFSHMMAVILAEWVRIPPKQVRAVA